MTAVLPRLIVTAAVGSFDGLESAMANIGWSVERRALIRFGPPSDWGPFDRAVAQLDQFQAVVVTSPRAAEVLSERLPQERYHVPLWVVGNRSGDRLEGLFETVHYLGDNPAEGGSAEALADQMLSASVKSPVLFPCGSQRRDGLIERLESAGVKVREEECYRTLLASPDAARVACHGAEAILVASPSVAALVASACNQGARPALVAIGPTTAAAARGAGWPPDAVATSPTPDGIRSALDSLQKGHPFA
ncbi:MAG: uroporphyrinogen-III synthase [Gemmatimonadales bacterium]|nr:MAG: uroporphyrinogen-III synthase [Gemmatimonadales bacterium]